MSSSSPRAVVLQGAPNFRDLGGIRVGDRRLAHGRVYRSEGLHALSDDDVRALGDLGIRLVCDLRTGGERTREVTRWPADATPALLHAGDAGVEQADVRVLGDELWRDLLRDDTGEHARDYMLALYRRMPDAYPEVLAQLIERIADGELPVVVHCTAGKDRTGFIISLLLLALGADRDQVEAEYLRSDEFFGTERLHELLSERTGVTPSDAAVDAFRTRAHLLDAALQEIVDQHGSIDAYLARAGLTDARREALRAALLA